MSRPSTSMSQFGVGGGEGPVPFLPGNSFVDPNRSNFRKSHAFDYRGGTAIEFGVPAKADATAPVRPQSRASAGPDSFNQSGRQSQQEEFVPAFAGLDGKVLRFEAFTTEQVPENLTEPFRVRNFTILYFLVDDSIQINEHRQANSGYAQGVFMKRHRVVKRAGGKQGEDFVTLFDFANSPDVELYNRSFRLITCNAFTEQFFEVNNMRLVFESQVPEDKYMAQRALTESRMGRRTPNQGGGNILDSPRSEMEQFRPDTNMSMGSSTGGLKRDMREKFLKYANKVLRFYAQWDDRGSMFGQKLDYVINYFLQDDKIEVLEVKKSNSGRDPFPKLVKKQRVPRTFKGIPSVGSKEADFESEYINEHDFAVGSVVEIFGREMYLYDCDSFTREYYAQQHGTEQSINQLEPDAMVEFPSMPLPPYNGFGSEHDSLASYFNLIPKPRKFDATKMAKMDTIIFRWKAKFDMDAMTSPNPDDFKRRFVVSYFMGDGSISIYEPPIQNSGFAGGKFLERQRIIRYKSAQGFGDWMSEVDLLVELPGTVWINNYPFILMETDKFTLRYVNNGRIDSLVDINNIHAKIAAAGAGKSRQLLDTFRDHDNLGTGMVSLEDLVTVVRKFDFDLDEDELIALMAHWDIDKGGYIDYEPLVSTIFDR